MSHSYSSMTRYLTCPASYSFRYINGIRVRGERPSNRHLGSAVHAGLAGSMLDYGHHRSPDVEKHVRDWGKENEPDFTLMDENGLLYCDIVEWDDMLKRAIRVAERFIGHLDFDANYEVLWHGGEPLAEVSMTAEILGADNTLIGIPDAVVRNKSTGAVEVWDFKVGEKQQGYEYYLTSQQLPLYVCLVEANTGIRPDVAVIWQIKNQTPQIPGRNKSDEPGKRVSRAAITTDWPTYSAAVAEYGDDPALYDDMRVKLLGKANEWFERMAYSYSRESLDFIWDNARTTVRSINEAKHFPRVLSPFSCQRCEFRDLCAQVVSGGDVTALFAPGGRYFFKESENA